MSTTCWSRNHASSSRDGKLDEAEAKARQAQRMNVVPALTADRAESVLHEIAMARRQTGARRRLAGTATPRRRGNRSPA